MPSGRMAPLARLPIFLALEGRRTVLAGGSAAAAWKAELLSAAGARVDVHAADMSEEIRALAVDPPRGSVALHARPWMAADLTGAAVAVGTFENDSDAALFVQAARHAGVPVNVIDKPLFCDFAFGAIVNRSPLVIGISTDGAAPVFAQAIRAKLEAMLPKAFAAWAAAAQSWRTTLKERGLNFSARRMFWQRFSTHAMTNPQRAPTENDFDRLLGDVTNANEHALKGSVILVGAGPGDPELLTLRAVRALQSADVILFDDLVSRDILDFSRREARKMLVGKTGFEPSCRQNEINQLMVGLAKRGKRVVRLKGGDPMIFARAAEEIETCRSAGIDVDVVPGISAAQGAAATLRLPLTLRGRTRRLQYVTAHSREDRPADLDWKSLADPATTTAVYMPRRALAELIDAALAHGLAPETPAIAIASATRPDQRSVRAEVRDLVAQIEQANLEGPLLVLLNASGGAAQPATRLNTDVNAIG